MNFNKMTKQQLKDYGESVGIKLNLKHKKDDLIDQLNKSSQTNADNTIKADVKVEVTNATTEKAFKAVGDTISSGKQAVTTGAKATTSFAKKIMVPVIILAIIGGIGAYVYDQKKQKEDEAYYNQRQAERWLCIAKREKNSQNMTEKQSCVYREYKTYDGNREESWDWAKTMCRLSYSELRNYQKWYSESFSCD